MPVLPPATPFIKSSGLSALLGSGGSSAITGALSSVGSFLGGPLGGFAGSVLSSAFGGKKKRGPSISDQLAASLQNTQNHFKFYKREGIHPLVAMGGNISSGPSSYHGDGFKTGQNFGRIAEKTIEGFRETKLAKLAVERAELENDLLRSQITSVNQQPGDSQVAMPNKKIPMWIEVYDRNTGKTHLRPNPEATEGIESIGFPAGTIISTDAAIRNVAPNYYRESQGPLKRAHAREKGRVQRRRYDAEQRLLNRYYRNR
jgi:hypothetical protein